MLKTRRQPQASSAASERPQSCSYWFAKQLATDCYIVARQVARKCGPFYFTFLIDSDCGIVYCQYTEWSEWGNSPKANFDSSWSRNVWTRTRLVTPILNRKPHSNAKETLLWWIYMGSIKINNTHGKRHMHSSSKKRTQWISTKYRKALWLKSNRDFPPFSSIIWPLMWPSTSHTIVVCCCTWEKFDWIQIYEACNIKYVSSHLVTLKVDEDREVDLLNFANNVKTKTSNRNWDAKPA